MSHVYPPIQPYSHEFLDVGDGHQLYIEQTGNPDGIPVLYLHGGPGAGLCASYRSLFNPEKYRVIGFDQRGCGKSTPFAALENNTTQDLLKDIQKIRAHFGIRKWVLCGGSWGATLALLAAIEDPKSIKAIVLRGTFMARQQDFHWFLDPQGGAAQLFPDVYKHFIEHVQNKAESETLVDAYYRIFVDGDEISRMAAAKGWCIWEQKISQLNNSVNEQDLCQNLHRATSLAMLECHYLKHNCFIPDNFILDNVKTISAIPGTLIHGRYDIVCKLSGAYELSHAWRNSQLLIVPESGHSNSEPLIADSVRQATDAMIKFFEEEKF